MRRRFRFSLRADFGLLRKQIGFGAKSYVQTLNNHLLLRADNYLVSDFLGPSQLAFYSLGSRFTEMLLEIPQAVGTVLYPRLASLSDHEIHTLTAQACRRTLLLTGLCSVPLLLLGPYVITPWLCAGALAFSVFVMLTRDFTSRNQQGVNIAAGIPALVSNVALNLFLIPAFGILGAAMATALSYSAACVILLVLYLPRAHLSLADVLIPKREDFRFFWNLLRRGTRRRVASAPAGT
jgi:O-antigen/teichoic acid export membrane protein